MTNTALQTTLEHIGDAFREERKPHQNTMLSGHRVMTLVQNKRYSFPEACRLLEVKVGEVNTSFAWLDADNKRINSRFNSTALGHRSYDLEMRDWFTEQETALESDVVQFKGAAC